MINLHIGCGKRDFGKKWEGIDGADFPHIKSHDITHLEYLPNIVDNIYSAHTLEYFDRENVLPILQEWNRVLKPEGNLYLSVPDFRAMTELYLQDNIPLHKFLGPLFGKMPMDDTTIYHKTVWDYQSLGEYLRIAGFRRIEPWTHNELEQLVGQEFDDHSKAKINGRLISLNIKCQK